MRNGRHSTRIVAGVILLAALGASIAAEESDAPPPVAAAAIGADDDRLIGLVEPSRFVTIGSPLDGEVASIAVQENDSVLKGAVLVELDSELQANVAKAAELEVDRRAMMLQEAEIQLDRIKGLRERGAAQEWEVRQSELQRALAALEVERAKQAVKQEQDKLRRYTLRAPFAGRVIRIESEAGAVLRNADKILTLIQLDPLEVTMHAPVELFGKFESGADYRFAAGAPVGRQLVGKLKSTEPRVDTASRTFAATFTIQNADQSLPTGFPVRLIWPQ